MNRVFAAFAAVALLAAPVGASAQNRQPLLYPAAQSTTPPADAPHAFTPAPVSGLGDGLVSPVNRAGGADDAGPMNATPFSGELSTVLTGSQTARALSESRIDRDPGAATQWGD